MGDYKVTRLVTSFGYFVGFGMIVLLALAGLAADGVKGLLIGLAAGFVFCVPFLMFCEAAHALVTIANNTNNANKKPEQNKTSMSA